MKPWNQKPDRMNTKRRRELLQKAFKLDPIDEAAESIIGPLIEILQYKLDKNGNLKRNKMRN
jgi:hypothetical protein